MIFIASHCGQKKEVEHSFNLNCRIYVARLIIIDLSAIRDMQIESNKHPLPCPSPASGGRGWPQDVISWGMLNNKINIMWPALH